MHGSYNYGFVDSDEESDREMSNTVENAERVLHLKEQRSHFIISENSLQMIDTIPST